jgi:anti-sigma regulatory factor (Ser/Thr protein kinase)
MAADLGFNPEDVARTALVATELATNIVKHGAGGALIATALPSAASIELIATDKGPGMDDTAACLQDGFSRTGTMGAGLGMIRRQADAFDLHSASGDGTVVTARVTHLRHSAAAASNYDFAGISVPVAGETLCGDAWMVAPHPAGPAVLVVDGLGHGAAAAEAAEAALDVFAKFSDDKPANLLTEIHQALRATRGAAVAAAQVDRTREIVRFAGLGNIAASVVSTQRTHSAVSHNGTAGYQAARIGEFTYPWTGDSVLVMHSDGVRSRWDADVIRRLAGRRSAVVAAVLFRDFARERDDATVVVMRNKDERA